MSCLLRHPPFCVVLFLSLTSNSVLQNLPLDQPTPSSTKLSFRMLHWVSEDLKTKLIKINNIVNQFYINESTAILT